MLDKINVKYCKILSCVQTNVKLWGMTQEEALATNEFISQQ